MTVEGPGQAQMVSLAIVSNFKQTCSASVRSCLVQRIDCFGWQKTIHIVCKYFSFLQLLHKHKKCFTGCDDLAPENLKCKWSWRWLDRGRIFPPCYFSPFLNSYSLCNCNKESLTLGTKYSFKKALKQIILFHFNI